jgi:hypothetical protein
MAMSLMLKSPSVVVQHLLESGSLNSSQMKPPSPLLLPSIAHTFKAVKFTSNLLKRSPQHLKNLKEYGMRMKK